MSVDVSPTELAIGLGCIGFFGIALWSYLSAIGYKDLAFRDPLTRLPNRAYFLERADLAIARAPDDGRPVTVMFLDLDDFKLVNDTLGHAVGDRLLVEVADRIRTGIRAEDVAARLGGDEFTIMLEAVPDVATALRVATRVAEAICRPIDVGDRAITISVSIGIAMGVPGIDTSGDVLRKADLAMYHGKVQGSTRYTMFDPSMQLAMLGRVVLEPDGRPSSSPEIGDRSTTVAA